MQKLNKLMLTFLVSVFLFGTLNAQTVVLNETLLTQDSFNTFTAASITGDQTWTSSQYGAMCSGYYAGQNHQNEDWLVSPALDLSGADDAQLVFDHTRGSASVVNVGVTEGWYKVYATSDYTGDPATTTWTEITGVNHNVPQAWTFISSGNLVIPQQLLSAQTHIAFRYNSSDSQSSTWEIKNIKVTADPPATASVFKITNWNTEWLGCTEEGPGNETQQMNNVITALNTINADVYCLQEVINTNASPTIETIVNALGSTDWGGAIVPSNTGDCNQRQGLIYRKSKVQFISAEEMNSGSAAEGGSYYYNWSSGRYPAVYNVNLLAGSTLIPVTLVNIHAKAEIDNQASNYTRRLGASEALKENLDAAAYNSKNVVVIGDFNDYLVGTTSNTCNCTESPYKNFMDDTAHYVGVTADLMDVNTNWGTHPLIENIVLSDELFDNYIENSVYQESTLPQLISNYYYTTSDHLPVSVTLQFETLGLEEVATKQVNALRVYPNPVNQELNIIYSGDDANFTTEIYDLTGRKVYSGVLVDNILNVSNLPSGVYLIKAGGQSTKFIKK